MKIILISGKAEAGKTTAANIIKQNLEMLGHMVAITPYGQYVKDTAKMIFDWNGKKDEVGRSLLQNWGTDIVRRHYPHFWVETVQRLALVLRGYCEYIIVDDCRFKNEIESWYAPDFMDDDIITIRIDRPGHENSLTPEQRQHPSETDLDDYSDFDIYLSASNIEELEEQIQKVFRALNALDEIQNGEQKNG